MIKRITNKEIMQKLYQEIKFFDKTPEQYDIENFENTIMYKVFANEEIGYVLMSDNKDGSYCLWGLYVKDKYRNKGYGRYLLEDMIRRYKNKCNYIYGFVEKDNEIAKKMYSKYYYLKKGGILSKIDKVENIRDSEVALNDYGDYKVCFYYKGVNA